MADTPRLSSQPPGAAEPIAADQSALSAAIGWLRAELDSAESDLIRSLLLYESGALHEGKGDPVEAQRYYTEAYQTEGEFREPLERLVALAEGGQSRDKLDEWLEELGKAADTPEERARIAVEQAVLALLGQADVERASELLEQAVSIDPSEPAAWILLELVSYRLEDPSSRQRALWALVQLVQDPTWRGLLLIELSELQRASGDDQEALHSLKQAADQPSRAVFPALLALEQFARSTENTELLVSTMVRQKTALETARSDPDAADALGVPKHRRDPRYLADVCARLALAQEALGASASAELSLQQAFALVPEDLLIRCLKLLQADRAGRLDEVVALASQLAGQAPREMASALWQRVAQAELIRGEHQAATEAARRGLEANPASTSLRVLNIDLSAGATEPSTLAAAIEQAADRPADDDAKIRLLLLAAEAWARLAKDDTASRAALERASTLGADPLTLARVSRVLAGVSESGSWYQTATVNLLEQLKDADERSDLALELLRLRLLHRDMAGATQAVSLLGSSSNNGWLGTFLEAIVLPILGVVAGPKPDEGGGTAAPTALGDVEPSRAFERLASLADDPGVGRALRIAGAFRDHHALPADRCLPSLRQISEEDPSDVVMAVACSEAELAEGHLGSAQQILLRTAAAVEDPEFGAALALRAAWLGMRESNPSSVEQALAQAEQSLPNSGAVLARWALRLLSADDLAARRAVLECSSITNSPVRLGLERFGLEQFFGDPELARVALSSLDCNDTDELSTGGLLLRALTAEGRSADTALARLVDRVGAMEPLRLAHDFAVRLQRDTVQKDPMARLELAAHWARHDSSLLARLEWLSAAICAEQTDEEILAREALVPQLEGDTQALVDLSARLLRWLTAGTSHALVPTTSAAARLANAEMSPPGCDPRRRAVALAELSGLLDPAVASTLDVTVGFNHLTAGDTARAEECFRRAIASDASDIAAFEGLRLVGELRHDKPVQAEACECLGDLVSDRAQAAGFWEQAATLWLDEVGDAARGDRALARAVDIDVGRTPAFDRLFRRVREANDSQQLLELISRRLGVTNDGDELVKLHWERARALRALGDREEALVALESLALLEPDHVGALALTGEIYIGLGRHQEAAQALARLCVSPDAPEKQRVMGAIAAVDLYDTKLSSPQAAFDVLEGLRRDGISNLALRERLAKIAVRVERWDVASEMLEQLMRERETPEARREAARLAIVIHRDKRGCPEDARAAIEQMLAEGITDAEAVEALLATPLKQAARHHLLSQVRDALRQRCIENPLDPRQCDRLARVAAELDDLPTREVTLGVLLALGAGNQAVEAELVSLGARVRTIPTIAVSSESLPDLADPEDTGPIAELFADFSTVFAEALGPTLGALSVTKKNRVDPRAGLPLRTEIAAWAGALGLGDFDLYVSDNEANGVVAVPGDHHAIVIPSSFRAPLPPAARQAVVRELYALRRGTVLLRHRSAPEVAALVVACSRIGGHELKSPPYALTDEFTRLVTSALPRRLKKTLQERAWGIAELGTDPETWYHAAVCSLDRMAALAAGDVSFALATVSGKRGILGGTLEAKERGLRLLRFVFSARYLEIREQMGLSVR